MGYAEIRTPSQTLGQIWMPLEITTSAQGVVVQNLIKINSAVAALRIVKKNGFWCGFYGRPA